MPRKVLDPKLDALKERLLMEIEDLRGATEGIVRDLNNAVLDIEQEVEDLENSIHDIFDDLETDVPDDHATPEAPDEEKVNP